MILEQLRAEIVRYSTPENLMDCQRFHKERLIKKEVLRTQILRRIAADYFKKIRHEGKEDILTLCEELLKSQTSEERGIAFNWAYRLRKRYEEKDFPIFTHWLKDYVHSWSSCDDLSCNILGHFISKFPKYQEDLKEWAISSNRWFKRSASVSLIRSLKQRQGLDTLFDITEILINDRDDLVQKGYGWMLKVASKTYPEEVFTFILAHKSIMPRTSLRYAIEHYPDAKKQEAMRR